MPSNAALRVKDDHRAAYGLELLNPLRSSSRIIHWMVRSTVRTRSLAGAEGRKRCTSANGASRPASRHGQADAVRRQKLVVVLLNSADAPVLGGDKAGDVRQRLCTDTSGAIGVT